MGKQVGRDHTFSWVEADGGATRIEHRAGQVCWNTVTGRFVQLIKPGIYDRPHPTCPNARERGMGWEVEDVVTATREILTVEALGPEGNEMEVIAWASKESA